MSISFFLGIKSSYTDEGQADAEEFIDAINAALKARNLPEYVEDRQVRGAAYGIGRSRLSNFGAGGLCEFVTFAEENGLGCAFDDSGPREVDLPQDFAEPIAVPFGKFLWLPRKARVGSAQALTQSLLHLAEPLGIPTSHANIANDVAKQICDMQRLRDEDDVRMLEFLRLAWLLYFEGARRATESGQALCLSS